LAVIACDVRRAGEVAADARSFWRLAADLVLYRVMSVVRPPGMGRRRTVRLKGDAEIQYRLDRGDVWVLREAWLQEAYRLPFDVAPTTLIDLGAHIGLVTIWLALRYGCSRIVAVEPLPANVQLLRSNLARDGVQATVIPAAVGRPPGSEVFSQASESSAGRLGQGSRQVRVVTPSIVLNQLSGDGAVDVMKIDIEGSEHSIFEGDLGWLDRVARSSSSSTPNSSTIRGSCDGLSRTAFASCLRTRFTQARWTRLSALTRSRDPRPGPAGSLPSLPEAAQHARMICMCGICGDTRDEAGARIGAMNAAMRHRGPDDEGTFVDPVAGFALGARRLSVIDVHGGHQPLANEDGTVWVVLNGEIYNHHELRGRLTDEGHRFRTGVDTEVLAHLYEERGERLVDELDGMFALAVWDVRRASLIVARDRFGEKPLFYLQQGNQLAFASELTALTAGAPTDGELNPESVDSFFVFGYVAGHRSILETVRQLPPGHLLRWTRSEGATVIPYWRPPDHEQRDVLSLADAAAEARTILERSVRSRMIADVPLGVFLSGGLDSTLIATTAAHVSSHPIKTFTVGYDVGQVSETRGAARVAKQIGADHHELILPSSEVAARARSVLRRVDQPLADEALVAFNAVSAFARRDVTVAVGGEGADELFGGYPRYRWLHRAERLGRAVPSRFASPMASLLRTLPLPTRAGRLADVLSPRSPLERSLDWVTSDRRHVRSRFYGERLRSATDPAAVVRELDHVLADRREVSTIGRFMRLDQLHWLPGDVLVKADRGSMLESLEVRTPFLNVEVAELAARVPPEVHTAGGGKAVLRRMLSDLMPDLKVPPKTAFRSPVGEWLRGPLASALSEQVDSGHLFSEGWFNRREVRSAMEQHLAGTQDWTSVLWPLLALGLWLDRFRGDG
jgi:asparagine synthase (glutamine-hydrolysing)